ncbi:hypothetical protein TREMEDRAFT_70106 [Tremella mesenterica DSM 1558]|uniref:uncharacterized protein n=1 Tax=Tremella mesenterica (strain ATCC 24925 / CBS 8224 / DSM 1558 / NBRC 9311 / NRRL Y-6157 / RJB 2259-6 / UBC 559-6) TaxID=578456 RepID=UPI00032CEA10|nr:uncharacterized protein TREMEDRAFT_70106 [Tremella mesenterica DSM 1558]EIW66522.1 hypothetical protein TREMEDRAFT_70106 [Tremella mesenterica DSM 1558]
MDVPVSHKVSNSISVAIPPPDERNVSLPELSKMKMVLLAINIMLTYFIATASVTATTLLLPKIAEDLGTSQLQTQWVVSAYTLTYGCTLMVSGRFADLYGRKMLFLSGLAVAAVFSILSAVIRNLIAICVLRALVGLGLAISSPAGFGIIGVTFRKEPARSVAFAAFGLGAPVGSTTGTILGGAVADLGKHGWAYLFYIIAGLAAIPCLLGLWIIPSDHRFLRAQAGDRRIDWLGGGLVTTAVFLLSFSITESGQVASGWKTPWIIVMLVLSLLLFIIFGFWEHHLETRTTLPPIIKISLFSRHGWKLTAINLTAFCIMFSAFSVLYTLALFYQDYKGLDALGNAIRLLPSNITGLFAAGGVMYLAPRFRAPVLIVLGCIATGSTSLLLAVEPRGTRYWYCEFWALILFPPGIDFTVCLGNIMISNLVSDDEQSVAGALFQLNTQIAAVLGVCCSSLIVTTRTQATGDILVGLRSAWWMSAAFAWCSGVIVAIMLRKVRLAKDIAMTLKPTGTV